MTTTAVRTLAVIILIGTIAACGAETPATPKTPAPATVTNHVTEASLTSVRLSPDAVKRLGIATATVAVEPVSRTRSVGGEIIAPPGGAVTVTAPAAGTLQAVGSPPAPGARVTRGQAMFSLFTIQSADRNVRIEAERDVDTAEAELTVVTQRLQRLERLLTDGATSLRLVEEARAQQRVTQANATSVRARAAELEHTPLGTAGSIVVRSPISGVLRSVSAAPGQAVAASAPLFEVVQTDTLWVRVALFVGERGDVDRRKPAIVTGLGSNAGAGAGLSLSADPIAGPPSADPTASTSDVFYVLHAPGDQVRPGERVRVRLPTGGTEQALVVPTAAVVYDLHGGAWVYEAADATTYVRRRIEIRSQSGNRTVLTRGIEAGAAVVTDGAAELFGTEFGAGK